MDGRSNNLLNNSIDLTDGIKNEQCENCGMLLQSIVVPLSLMLQILFSY